LSEANRLRNDGKEDEARGVGQWIYEAGQLLGLFSSETDSNKPSAVLIDLVGLRKKSRAEKNFKVSDFIRDELVR